MLNFLIYIYTVKGISLTLRFAILQMTPEEVEIQRQKEYIYFTRQKGITVYGIIYLFWLKNYFCCEK